MPQHLIYAACTDKGRIRENNEDSFRVLPAGGLAVVADGMGGHLAGEVASNIAIEAVCHYLSDHQFNEDDQMQALMTVGSAVELANQMIRQETLQKPELTGMGTTIVVTLFHQDRLYYAHVGDSRLYRFSDNRMEQLTTDHSLVQMLVDRGSYKSIEHAISAGVGANMLTRGLGVEEQVEVDLNDLPIDDDSLYLLCTDGLTSMLSDIKIADIINKNRNDLDAAVEVLIAESLSAGGHDNVTVILIKPQS